MKTATEILFTLEFPPVRIFLRKNGRLPGMTTSQNSNIEPAGETNPGRNWNGWDVFFMLVPILCIILLPLGPLGVLDYLRGRRFIFLFDLLDKFILYSLICFLNIFFIFYGFVRLSVSWKNYTRKKRFLIGVEIGIPIIFITLLIVSLCVPVKSVFWPDSPPFLCGFRDWVKSNADISAVRNWVKTLDKEELSYYSQYSHYDELPEFVKEIGGDVGFSKDSNGNPRASFLYGGGFFHWGVEIWAEDMKIPPSDYVSKRMYVEPGVYIIAW